MRATVGLILLCAVAAVAADTNEHTEVKSLCSRDECTCRQQDGLQRIRCDCGEADGGTKALAVGAAPDTSLPVGTTSLGVHRCGAVKFVSNALVNASQLADLELSDIGRLELQPGSLHRAGDGPPPPPLRLTVQRVADLRLHPEAFQQVGRLERVEFTEVVSGSLLLYRLVDASDLVSVHLADSQSEDVRLSLNTVHSVSITNCTMDSLHVTAAAVRSVTIADNTMVTLRWLRLNRLESPHGSDADVVIARNNITYILANGMAMALDELTLVNNTLLEWMAPLRVEFRAALISGNDISRLGDLALRELIRVNSESARHRRPTAADTAESALTFSLNKVRASSHGQYGPILTPAEVERRETALFRVTGNRFTCRCEELVKLVQNGEQQLQSAPTDNDQLFRWDQVYGQLYRTSSCLQDGRSLQQYRQDAYTDQLECLSNGVAAAAAAVSTLTLLLAAAGIII